MSIISLTASPIGVKMPQSRHRNNDLSISTNNPHLRSSGVSLRRIDEVASDCFCIRRDVSQKSEALNSTFPEALKKSILQEAVQGKLVPQDPTDEPAEALLERIRAKKAAAHQGRKNSKRISTNPSFSEGIILIMRSWTVWSAVSTMNYPLRSRNRGRGCAGGSIAESIQYGYNAPANEESIRMVRISDIHENYCSMEFCPIL